MSIKNAFQKHLKNIFIQADGLNDRHINEGKNVTNTRPIYVKKSQNKSKKNQ